MEILIMDKEQELLAKVLDLFARRFDKKAVLRGGMVLRVLGSPRLTNDLDYVFVPYKSRKDIVKEVIGCLESIPGAQVTHSLNSKCLRVVLTVEQVAIQIEAKVAMTVNTDLASTRLFSTKYNLPQRMIPVVRYSDALANKMAAWNERRLIRDLYDTWFFLQMNILPDAKTLEARLADVCYSRLVKKEDYFKGRTVKEFYEFLRNHASKLSDADIAKELSDYLPQDQIQGMSMLFRSALARL
jgi:predicted nucleotidyltransferase component of viral defense system